MQDHPARILVVDDDASFGRMVAEILTGRGYEVVALTDPAEALARASREEFSAAVLDLMMPHTGGIELATRLREQRPDIQSLILTGHGDMESAIAGLQHGIVDYLQKGTIEAERLSRSVRAAVDKYRLVRENRELLERLRESNRLLKAVNDLSAEITGEQHLDRLLDRLVASARELCGGTASRAMLFSRSHSEEELIVRAAVGDGADAVRGARIPPEVGIALLCARTQETLLLERGADHPAYSHRCDEMPTTLPGLLCAPLRHGSVNGAILVAGSRTNGFSTDARDVLTHLARQAAVCIDNALSHEAAVNFFTHTSDMLVSILDRVDIYLPGHGRAVAALADMVTRRLGMTDAERRSVHFGALLHDIGKIMIDHTILKAEGGLTDDVRRRIQQHPVLGVELLRPIMLWEDILPIIHGHHERWDGKGYPAKLAGEEIPIGARVVAVTEAFDAMTRAQPYSPKRTPEEAITELEAFAGSQFDPRIVRLFVAEYRQHAHQLRD
jgi:putative nucleotidyltransferase with HDIG domain